MHASKGRKWEWTMSNLKWLTSKTLYVPTHFSIPSDDRAFSQSRQFGYALEHVLSQMRDDNKWHPVVYISKVFLPPNHSTSMTRVLAVIRALEKWCIS